MRYRFRCRTASSALRGSRHGSSSAGFTVAREGRRTAEMRSFFRYWRDPGYWRWRWGRASDGAKVTLGVLLAVLVGLGGFYTAQGLAGATDSTAAYVPPAQKVVTVQRTL